MRPFGIDFGKLTALPFRTMRSAFAANKPFKATVALTYRCPHRCYYCGVWTRGAEELTARAYADALASVPSVTWLDVTGGEIFTRPDIHEVCAAMVEILPRLSLFHFPTSGSHPESAAALAEAIAGKGIKVVVTVSIEGPRELHDRVRGTAGAFDRAVETLNHLKAIPGVSSYVGTTILAENISIIPNGIYEAVATACPGLKRHDMHFNVMQGSDHYFCNRSASRPRTSDIQAALRRILVWKGFPRTPFDALEVGFQVFSLHNLAGKGAFLPRCAALKASFFLAPGGILYPCHIWGEPLGAVGPGTGVGDLLNSDRSRWLRARVEADQCPRCWTPCEAYPSLIDGAFNPLHVEI